MILETRPDDIARHESIHTDKQKIENGLHKSRTSRTRLDKATFTPNTSTLMRCRDPLPTRKEPCEPCGCLDSIMHILRTILFPCLGCSLFTSQYLATSTGNARGELFITVSSSRPTPNGRPRGASTQRLESRLDNVWSRAEVNENSSVFLRLCQSLLGW